MCLFHGDLHHVGKTLRGLDSQPTRNIERIVHPDIVLLYVDLLGMDSRRTKTDGYGHQSQKCDGLVHVRTYRA